MTPAVAVARCCVESTHARMKADPVLFLACSFRGILHLGQTDPLMLRQCPRCDQTVGMRMSKVAEMYPLVEYAGVTL